jgi:two-component system phosphate regulon response regulator PhoB/two-component system alkaline phosphatase synthesis response regulator PhoP
MMISKKLIAIVDDEQDILELVSIHVKKHGFEAKKFLDAQSFMNFLEHQKPSLIILDVMLPDADGMDVCKKLKSDDRYSHIPIIMLTAKGEETDKILGLELGADDYVTKPFSPRELVARVKSVLRRNVQVAQSQKTVIADVLEIDFQRYEAKLEGEKVDLTPTEFRILKLLSRKKGWVYTREQILDYLWGNDKAVLSRTVDVHIKNLRDKLGDAGKIIKNVRGVGYKIEE